MKTILKAVLGLVMALTVTQAANAGCKVAVSWDDYNLNTKKFKVQDLVQDLGYTILDANTP